MDWRVKVGRWQRGEDFDLIIVRMCRLLIATNAGGMGSDIRWVYADVRFPYNICDPRDLYLVVVVGLPSSTWKLAQQVEVNTIGNFEKRRLLTKQLTFM